MTSEEKRAFKIMNEEENCRRMLLDIFGDLYVKYHREVDENGFSDPERVKIIADIMAKIHTALF